MTVGINLINDKLKRLNRDVGLNSTTSISNVLSQQIASRSVVIGKNGIGETLGGFTAITSEFDQDASYVPGFGGSNLVVTGTNIEGSLSELTPDISAEQADVNALSGDLNTTGSASAASLKEIVTIGTPEAINFTGKNLTGRTTEGMRDVLQDVAIPSVNVETVIEGINNLDINDQQQITSFISRIDNTSANTILSQIPTLSGKVVDDLIVSQDQSAWDQINNLLGDTILTPELSQSILTKLVEDNIDTASLIVQENTSKDFTLNQISERLSRIEVRPEKLLKTNSAEIQSNITIGRTRSGSYVDTAEEFEAEIAFCPRAISVIIWHTSSKQGATNITGKDIPPDYHYIIEPNGRVLRGMPIETLSLFKGGDTSMHIYVMPATPRPNVATSSDQQKTINELNLALSRVIPGALQRSYGEEIREDVEIEAGEIPPQLPFRPAGVACASINRSSAGNSGTGKVLQVVSDDLIKLTTYTNKLEYIVNKSYAKEFDGFVRELEQDLDYEIWSISGYNYRKVAGSNSWSWHAYGLAIDINPTTNSRPRDANGNQRRDGFIITDLPSNGTGSKMPDLATKYKLTWGGLWQWPDAMHFDASESVVRPLQPIRN